jgi:hypothetical protein
VGKVALWYRRRRLKEMSDEEIESLKSLGNKEQVKYFMELVEQSNQG